MRHLGEAQSKVQRRETDSTSPQMGIIWGFMPKYRLAHLLLNPFTYSLVVMGGKKMFVLIFQEAIKFCAVWFNQPKMTLAWSWNPLYLAECYSSLPFILHLHVWTIFLHYHSSLGISSSVIILLLHSLQSCYPASYSPLPSVRHFLAWPFTFSLALRSSY